MNFATEPIKPIWVTIDFNQIEKFESLVMALAIADDDNRKLEILKEMKSRLQTIRNLIEFDNGGSNA